MFVLELFFGWKSALVNVKFMFFRIFGTTCWTWSIECQGLAFDAGKGNDLCVGKGISNFSNKWDEKQQAQHWVR
jgi:hypothetical protein